MLKKPKRITLSSNVNGEKVEMTYNIGRYDGFDGLFMIGIVAELLDSAARKKMLSTDKVFAKKLQDALKEQGKFIEVVTDDGAAPLDTVNMLKASVPDLDIALQLMREVHDYNTSLFSTANLFKKSSLMTKQLKELGMKISKELLASFSAKKQRQSKS